jgi:hypothetical protein
MRKSSFSHVHLPGYWLIRSDFSYPQRVDAMLVVICSFRGFIGFGISYGTIAFVDQAGYEGAFNIFAGIVGAFMFLGIPAYFVGKQIRKRTQQWAVDKGT